MRSLRYCINISLDGCVDHRVGLADEETHKFHARSLERADALLYGRITYSMMQEGWRSVAESGLASPGMPQWVVPFAQTIDAARKYVVTNTLPQVDWNAQIIRGGELERAVRELKAQPGKELLTGGVTLPLALAELDLIDLYEFVVYPRIAGRGPTLLAGLSKFLDLKLVDQERISVGSVVLRYEPVR